MQMHWANLLQPRVRVMGMHLGDAGAGCGWLAAMSIDRADRRSVCRGIGHKLVVAPCRHANAKTGVLLLLAGQLIDAGEIRLASLDDAVHRWPHCLLWVDSEVPKLEHLHFHRFRYRKSAVIKRCRKEHVLVAVVREIFEHRLGIFLGVLKEIAAVVCDALDLTFRETVSSRHLFAKAREAAVLAERVEDFPGGMGERVNRDAVGILEEKANGYYKLPARRFKFCDLHSHGNSAL